MTKITFDQTFHLSKRKELTLKDYHTHFQLSMFYLKVLLNPTGKKKMLKGKTLLCKILCSWKHFKKISKGHSKEITNEKY